MTSVILFTSSLFCLLGSSCARSVALSMATIDATSTICDFICLHRGRKLVPYKRINTRFTHSSKIFARLTNFWIHWDFPLFCLSFIKFTRIAKNRKVDDFSQYLRFPQFFVLLFIKSKASCGFSNICENCKKNPESGDFVPYLRFFAVLCHANDH